MKQICKHNKSADIAQTVQGLEVNVCNAIETGIIQDTSALVFHNMMENLGEVGMVARDPFDIIEYDRTYAKFRKYVEDEADEK